MEEPVVNKPSSKKWLWISVIIIVLLVAAGTVYAFVQKKSESGAKSSTGNADLSNLIQADFIDLDKIFSISKFRSGSGHDFSSGSGETCRSMKHYFNPQWSAAGDQLKQQNNGMAPAPDGKTDIAIYSPVDGRITGIAKEKTPIGEQIYIEPDSNHDVIIRIFHVYKLDGIAKDSIVKAGQQIGNIGQYSSTDISVENGRGHYLSYFEVMPDTIFAKYIARGAKDRSDFIFSKEYRDAHPFQCNGENFAVNYAQDANSGELFQLSGSTSGSSNNSGISSGSASAPAVEGSPSAEDTASQSAAGSRTGAGTGAGNGSGGGGGR